MDNSVPYLTEEEKSKIRSSQFSPVTVILDYRKRTNIPILFAKRIVESYHDGFKDACGYIKPRR